MADIRNGNSPCVKKRRRTGTGKEIKGQYSVILDLVLLEQSFPNVSLSDHNIICTCLIVLLYILHSVYDVVGGRDFTQKKNISYPLLFLITIISTITVSSEKYS